MNYLYRYVCLNDNTATRLIKQLSFYVVKARVKLLPYAYGLNRKQRDIRIIVSMTSYPKRFKTIIMPLKSLLLQSVKPDRIIVWLGSDSSEEMLTQEMKELKKYGVEYRFDSKRNLKPHKKYYYALQEFPDDLVITVDDDIIYPRGLIESLLEAHLKYPKAVCARRVHKVYYRDGKPLPYRQWGFEYRKECAPSDELMATNGAGTLFPPHALDQRAFISKDIEKYCLNADDIWLWFMEQLKGTLTVWVPCLLVHPPVVGESRNSGGLAQTNVESNGNDMYLKKLYEVYKDK